MQSFLLQLTFSAWWKLSLILIRFESFLKATNWGALNNLRHKNSTQLESAQLNELWPFINQKDALNINWLKKKAVNEREIRRKFFFVLLLRKERDNCEWEKIEQKFFLYLIHQTFSPPFCLFLYSSVDIMTMKAKKNEIYFYNNNNFYSFAFCFSHYSLTSSR